MKYLLDTDTVIDYFQDRGATRVRIEAMLDAGDELALCPITVTELYSGLSKPNEARWQPFLSVLTYWSISREVATQAGIDRKAAAESGRTLPLTDAMIA